MSNAFYEILEKIGLKGKESGLEEEKKPKSAKADPGFPGRMSRLLDMGNTFEGVTDKEIFHAILQSDVENLKKTMEQNEEAAFSAAVEMIQKARTIYIIGIRSCEPLAELLGFYLNMMFENVRVIKTSSVSEIFEQDHLRRGRCGPAGRRGHRRRAVCQQPECRSYCSDRQRPFTSESVFLLQPHCGQPDGIRGGFPDSSLKPFKRPGGGSRSAQAGSHEKEPGRIRTGLAGLSVLRH